MAPAAPASIALSSLSDRLRECLSLMSILTYKGILFICRIYTTNLRERLGKLKYLCFKIIIASED